MHSTVSRSHPTIMCSSRSTISQRSGRPERSIALTWTKGRSTTVTRSGTPGRSPSGRGRGSSGVWAPSASGCLLVGHAGRGRRIAIQVPGSRSSGRIRWVMSRVSPSSHPCRPALHIHAKTAWIRSKRTAPPIRRSFQPIGNMKISTHERPSQTAQAAPTKNHGPASRPRCVVSRWFHGARGLRDSRPRTTRADRDRPRPLVHHRSGRRPTPCCRSRRASVQDRPRSPCRPH